MSNEKFPIFRGLAAAAVATLVILSMASCSGGNPTADSELGITGSSGSSTSGLGGSGNSGGSSPYSQVTAAANTQTITVYDASFLYGYENEPMVTVEICLPGTTTCQTIPDILLDTGSYGLRLMASVVSLNLPSVTVSGSPLGECALFADGYDWGPVVSADVHLGGDIGAAAGNHTASSAPIQLMGSTTFAGIPNGCATEGSDAGLSDNDSVSIFGANGVLGVGELIADCGEYCAANASIDYWTCPNGICTESTAPIPDQVSNPAGLMPLDHNGVMVSLPSVSVDGTTSVTGTLVFGINTEGNNGLGSAQIYDTDAYGAFGAVYYPVGETEYPDPEEGGDESILDTGSAAYYVLEASSFGVAACTDYTFYYCPSTATNVQVEPVGTNGTNTTIGFTIDNTDSLATESEEDGYNVFNDLVGEYGGPGFDFGLPFFLGRNVFVGFETYAGADSGMYYAF